MDEHPKKLDLTTQDYRVVKGKKKEPIINWEYVPAAIGFLLAGAAGKLVYVFFIAK